MELPAGTQQLPLGIVGSTKFGRYPKISVEQTYNMFMSDDWLVPYAGHKRVVLLENIAEGRDIYGSTRLDARIAVVNNSVYLINSQQGSNGSAKIGELETSTGDVSIAENNGSQIAICDQKNIYIYDYHDNTFSKINTDFIPNHVCFQDGYFICAVANQPIWRLSKLNQGQFWPTPSESAAYQGGFTSKPNSCVACMPVPGKLGLLFVFGDIVTEAWSNLGLQLFPYQRASGFNIDYGCLSPSTIAVGDTFVIWLGINEKSGPTIIVSNGGQAEQIASDGINFRLSQLKNPSLAYGFLFKQDGHLFYQLTFPDPADNFTLIYDFNTKAIFNLCDEQGECHIAKRVTYFNNSYYFLGFNDGHVYELNSKYTTFNGITIPRRRITDTVRLPGNSRFIINSLSLTAEQGEPSDEFDPAVQTNPKIEIRASNDGGATFGNPLHYEMNPVAHRKNKVLLFSQGSANERTYRFDFWGNGRFVVSGGILNIYQ
jgi:hypothetical protein